MCCFGNRAEATKLLPNRHNMVVIVWLFWSSAITTKAAHREIPKCPAKIAPSTTVGLSVRYFSRRHARVAILLEINTGESHQSEISRRMATRACRQRECDRDGKGHCVEGAIWPAAILEVHGARLGSGLRSTKKPYDDDHVVGWKQFGCFGAISKTTHPVLRYREPIYKHSASSRCRIFTNIFEQRCRKLCENIRNFLI